MTYYSKPYGSGWFDCGCEPCEIICEDSGRSQNEINQCEPPPCESQAFLNGGFGHGGNGCGGNGGFGGFGGYGGYNECGWAATKGWAWWEGNNNGNYCDVPKFIVPDCDDEYLPPLSQQDNLNDFNYDPCGCDVT